MKLDDGFGVVVRTLSGQVRDLKFDYRSNCENIMFTTLPMKKYK